MQREEEGEMKIIYKLELRDGEKERAKNHLWTKREKQKIKTLKKESDEKQ